MLELAYDIGFVQSIIKMLTELSAICIPNKCIMNDQIVKGHVNTCNQKVIFPITFDMITVKKIINFTTRFLRPSDDVTFFKMNIAFKIKNIQ